MQHPVVGAAEAEIFEDGVGVAGEIAISKEQQLGELQKLRLRHGSAFARGPAIPPKLGFGRFLVLRQRLI
jgi:hypothetical protein